MAGGARRPHLLGVDLIAIYVEDHLALSLGGIRLARRCRGQNPGGELGAFLDRLIPELEEDRTVLKDVVRALGGSRSAVKEMAVAAGEWAGRLKLNGRLFSYSDLSRVWELEGLTAGTESRRGMWKVLARIAKKDARLAGFELERLEERARTQRESLERFRVRAAELAFGARKGRAQGSLPEEAPAR
jgi:hypothetical protein